MSRVMDLMSRVMHGTRHETIAVSTGFHMSHVACLMPHVIFPVFAMGDGSDSYDEELALCLLYRRARKRNCSRQS